MKLVSHRRSLVAPAPAGRRPVRRFPLVRWIRSRSGLERALFIKCLLTLLVAAIAIHAVSLLAHLVHDAEQNINP